MTPKEKAKELVDKFRNEFTLVKKDYNVDLYRDAKQCALIAVDEIIASNPCYEDADRGGNFMWNNNTYYFEEVKQEIENL